MKLNNIQQSDVSCDYFSVEMRAVLARNWTRGYTRYHIHSECFHTNICRFHIQNVKCYL